jgi:Asp-tRNA(Asn)/Glu-tRNA(Gln) amidotransferase A subunit family amidase
MSAYDLEEVTGRADKDPIHGLDTLSEAFQAIVKETIKTGKIVVPPERAYEAPAPKVKKGRKKKIKLAGENGADVEEPQVKVEESDTMIDELAITLELVIKAEEQIEEKGVKVEQQEAKAQNSDLL